MQQVAGDEPAETQQMDDAQVQAVGALRAAVAGDATLLAAVEALASCLRPKAPLPRVPPKTDEDLERIRAELLSAAGAATPEEKMARALQIVNDTVAKRRRGADGRPADGSLPGGTPSA